MELKPHFTGLLVKQDILFCSTEYAHQAKWFLLEKKHAELQPQNPLKLTLTSAKTKSS